jgi:hypothetical protein
MLDRECTIFHTKTSLARRIGIANRKYAGSASRSRIDPPSQAGEFEVDDGLDLAQDLIGGALLGQLPLEAENQGRIIQPGVDIAALVQQSLGHARVRMICQ